jgi:hypothetical protein
MEEQGATGVDTVRDNLAREQIEGTGETSLDGYTVPEGELVNTGTEARAFADLMRTHALEGSGGLVHAEMGRFMSAANPDDPAGTSDPQAAVVDEEGSPVPNPAHNTWVTQTALATALNQAYFGGGSHSSASSSESRSCWPASDSSSSPSVARCASARSSRPSRPGTVR